MNSALTEESVEYNTKYNFSLVFLFVVLFAGIVILKLIPSLNSVFPLSLYTPMHTTIEFLSVVIGVSVFIISWYNFKQTREIHEYIFCLVFLAVSIMDFAHAMSFVGMPDFFSPNSLTKSNTFWLYGRLLTDLGITVSVLFYKVKIKKDFNPSFFLFMTISLIAAALVSITGENTFLMKPITEYTLIFFLAVSLILLMRRKNKHITEVYLLAAILMAIFGQIVLTFYSRGLDAYNLLGHIYRSGSEICILRALFVSSVVDLTEANRILREQQKKLNYVNEQLKKVNQLKTDFLANTNHELRTPLTAIIAFTELLMDEDTGSLNEIQKDYLMEINESGIKLLSEINNLLDLSRFEAGKMNIYYEESSIKEIIFQVIRQLQPVFQKKNQIVKTTIYENIPPIPIDIEKIKKVLHNLLTNAHKFTEPGGNIFLNAEVNDGSDAVIIGIKDTGIGLTEEQIKNIFDKFYTVENSLTRQQCGTGLGLTLAKHFVEMHGGKIWVDSEKEKGSAFYFTLPLRKKDKGVV